MPKQRIILMFTSAVEPIPFDSMTAVIEVLRKAGFTTVMGSVPLPQSG